jgi:exonuclease SbcC
MLSSAAYGTSGSVSKADDEDIFSQLEPLDVDIDIAEGSLMLLQERTSKTKSTKPEPVITQSVNKSQDTPTCESSDRSSTDNSTTHHHKTQPSSSATKKRKKVSDQPDAPENIPEEIKKLEAELAEFQAQYDKLKKKPSEAVTAAKKDWIKKEKNRLSSQISRHKKTISILQSKLQSEQLTQEKDKCKVELATLQQAKSHLEAQSQALTEKNSQLRKANDALVRMSEKDSQDLQTQKDLNETQQAVIKRLSSELLMLQEQGRLIINTNGSLTKRQSQYETVIRDQQRQIDELRAHRSQLECEFEGLEVTLDRKNQQIHDLQATVAKLEYDLNYLEYRRSEHYVAPSTASMRTADRERERPNPPILHARNQHQVRNVAQQSSRPAQDQRRPAGRPAGRSGSYT